MRGCQFPLGLSQFSRGSDDLSDSQYCPPFCVVRFHIREFNQRATGKSEYKVRRGKQAGFTAISVQNPKVDSKWEAAFRRHGGVFSRL
jgi:hypothetical protein